MRLTINLDADLYAMARSHAVATKTSIGKAVSDLLRRKSVTPSAPESSSTSEMSYFDPVLGIQVSPSRRTVTNQDVRNAIADDDFRHLEIAGWAIYDKQASPARIYVNP